MAHTPAVFPLSLLVWGSVCVLGCSGDPPRTEAPRTAGNQVQPLAIDAAPATTPVSEAHARLILEGMFRTAKLRVLVDVPLTTEIYLDGADPQKKIGYEYLAPGEPKHGLVPGQQEVGGFRVLVVGPSEEKPIRERARAFLNAVMCPEAGEAGCQ